MTIGGVLSFTGGGLRDTPKDKVMSRQFPSRHLDWQEFTLCMTYKRLRRRVPEFLLENGPAGN